MARSGRGAEESGEREGGARLLAAFLGRSAPSTTAPMARSPFPACEREKLLRRLGGLADELYRLLRVANADDGEALAFEAVLGPRTG